MAKSDKPRPLSPHVQVYRFPLAAILSIGGHRFTGIGLVLGLVLLTAWVASAAYGPKAYAAFTSFIGSPFGLFLLFGFSFSLFMHLCTGIRHLFWDAGIGYSIKATQRSNILVIVSAVVLTAISWLLAFT